MRTKKSTLTMYSNERAPLTVATRQAGEWHLHPVYDIDGSIWMEDRDYYNISHACGFLAYGPAPQVQCREVMTRLINLSPCPVDAETARAMNKRTTPQSPAYIAWLAQVRYVVFEDGDPVRSPAAEDRAAIGF